MRKQKEHKWKENGHPPPCPHCGAGGDGVTVGLYWDYDEHFWQCIICGYRGYDGMTGAKEKEGSSSHPVVRPAGVGEPQNQRLPFEERKWRP